MLSQHWRIIAFSIKRRINMYEVDHDKKPTVALAIGFVMGVIVAGCGFLGLVGLPHVG